MAQITYPGCALRISSHAHACPSRGGAIGQMAVAGMLVAGAHINHDENAEPYDARCQRDAA